jgi:hypothetical protein
VIARPAWIYRTVRHAKEFFMKNLYKLLGITALALAIVFSFAACSNPASNGGEGGESSGNGGDITNGTIAKGVQVKTFDITSQTIGGNSTYTGNFTKIVTGYDNNNTQIIELLSGYVPGSSIKVTNGKLDMTLGVPEAQYLVNPASIFITQGITISPSGAKVYGLGYSASSDETYMLGCFGKIDPAENEEAHLIYSDTDVNITGGNGSGGQTVTYNNFSLKKGWNYVMVLYYDSSNGNFSDIIYSSSQKLPSGYNWVIGAISP